jgi:hypothetical protein
MSVLQVGGLQRYYSLMCRRSRTKRTSCYLECNGLIIAPDGRYACRYGKGITPGEALAEGRI